MAIGDQPSCGNGRRGRRPCGEDRRFEISEPEGVCMRGHGDMPPAKVAGDGSVNVGRVRRDFRVSLRMCEGWHGTVFHPQPSFFAHSSHRAL